MTSMLEIEFHFEPVKRMTISPRLIEIIADVPSIDSFYVGGDYGCA